MPHSGKWEMIKCKYCNEPIGANAIEKHQKICKTATPEKRHQLAEYRRFNTLRNKREAARRKVFAPQKSKSDDNGRTVSVTLNLTEDQTRELLRSAIPELMRAIEP